MSYDTQERIPEPAEAKCENLHLNGLKIYQSRDGFRFGTDAVLLAWFCRRKHFRTAVDLCSGNGIVPLLLTVASPESVTGIEILESQCRLFEASVALNGLSDKVKCINGDVRQINRGDLSADGRLTAGSCDLVSVNPPYFEPGRGLPAAGDRLAARSEETCSAEDATAAAAYLLKHGGRLCMVHKPERLADIMEIFRKYRIEPKELVPVVPVEGRRPGLILIEGRKGGGKGLNLEASVTLTDLSGRFTQKACEIYGFDKNDPGFQPHCRDKEKGDGANA